MTDTAPSLPGLYVGTSGFSYASWRGDFYPPRAKPAEFLRLYSERLPSVELNFSFYQLPSEEQFAGWARETPDAFRFAVKMSRRITHYGRLESIPTFCARVRALEKKLGPVLVQFPPTRPRDDGFLRLFVELLDRDLDYAFEFRHPSWDEAADILAEAGIARVGLLEGEARFRYLRLREPPYEERDLAAWARRLRPLLARGMDVYVYFKHEDEPSAPRYAERLLALAREESGVAPPPAS